MNLLARLDDRCHRLNCRLIRQGHLRLFRFMRWIEQPLCEWVSLMDHVVPPRSRPRRRTRSTDDDDA